CNQINQTLMKNIIKIIILLFLVSPAVQAQTFENELQKVTENLSRQINKKPYKNIVIYPFWDNKKQTSDMGNMITDKFWVSLVNETNNFEVMDRGQLEYYFVEHQLNSEGLINPLTAKQFGMLIAADAFVSGNYYVLKSYISLNIKVVDVETGKMVTTLSGK